MTQENRIAAFMNEHGSITTLDAFQIGITRLAARVHDMRNKGVSIASEMVDGVNRYGEPIRYARYWMNEQHSTT